MITKAYKIVSDTVLGGFEEPLLRYQAGYASSAINSAATYIPCSIDKPISVIITPFNYPNDANNVAFASGYEVASLENLDDLSVLPTITSGVDYLPYQFAKYNDNVYQCLVSHTAPSGNPFVESNWQLITDKKFLRLDHTAPGANKVAVFSFLILGYDL